MDHEGLFRLAVQSVHDLSVLGRAQGGGDQRLGFAAGEQRRAVGAGHDPHLDVDGPDLLGAPAVGPRALHQDLLAEDLFLQFLEDAAEQDLLFLLFLGDGAEELVLHGVHGALAGELARGVQRGQDLVGDRLPDFGHGLGGHGRRLHHGLDRLFLLRQMLDQADDLANLLMGQQQRLEQDLFADFLGRGLHHHDGLLGAGDHQVQAAGRELGRGRIDHVLVVDVTHAHARDGGGEGNVRQIQRRRGAADAHGVGVVDPVRRKHQRDDLGVAEVALRKQGAQRSVDEAAGQDLFLRRPALALVEAARKLAGGVSVLTVINGQGQERGVLPGFGGGAGRGHDHGVAVADERRAVRLLGQPAGLDGQLAAPDFNRCTVNHIESSRCVCLPGVVIRDAGGASADGLRMTGREI